MKIMSQAYFMMWDAPFTAKSLECLQAMKIVGSLFKKVFDI